MMINCDELTRNLSFVNAQLNAHHGEIDHTLSELKSAVERVQTFFAHQSLSSQVLMSLSTAEGFLQSADSSLYSLSNEISNYINQIRK